jgi:DNA-binding transcriptional ArsR family regulator
VSDRVPPNNIEAEESVLGSMILSHQAVAVAQETLQPDDFYKEAHRVLFKVISENFDQGRTSDPVVLVDELKRRGLLDSVGDKAYVLSLIDTTPNPDNVGHYSAIVRDHATRRRLIDGAHRLIAAAHLGEPVEDVIDTLQDLELKKAPGFETITAEELQCLELPPLTYVIEELLPAGLTFFAGAYKTGKSFMALDVGSKVAAGEPFFDMKTTQGEVLFVGAEDNLRRLQHRIRSMSDSWPADLHIATSMPRLDDGGVDALEQFVRGHPDTRLIVLDVWARVRGKEKSRNAYLDDYAALEALQDFASEKDIAILVVHHHRKSRDDNDPFNRFSGSTGIGGGADALWTLERERGECNASFKTTGRDIREAELALDFNDETGEWKALGLLSEYMASKARHEIVEVLREAGGALGPKEIAESLDKNQSTTRNLLSKMVDAGEVEKAGRGKYQVVEVEDEPFYEST